ncbi:hypothetical protein SESBI_17827 [Sesbania bispinosa]|nr:hypothetical protein SESBI_17827 [Sesbania bispinosa]
MEGVERWQRRVRWANIMVVQGVKRCWKMSSNGNMVEGSRKQYDGRVLSNVIDGRGC